VDAEVGAVVDTKADVEVEVDVAPAAQEDMQAAA